MNEEYLLSPKQRESLAEYCEANGVAQEDRDLLSRLTGRGYRPPVTARGWQDMYELLKKMGCLVECSDD